MHPLRDLCVACQSSCGRLEGARWARSPVLGRMCWGERLPLSLAPRLKLRPAWRGRKRLASPETPGEHRRGVDVSLRGLAGRSGGRAALLPACSEDEGVKGRAKSERPGREASGHHFSFLSSARPPCPSSRSAQELRHATGRPGAPACDRDPQPGRVRGLEPEARASLNLCMRRAPRPSLAQPLRPRHPLPSWERGRASSAPARPHAHALPLSRPRPRPPPLLSLLLPFPRTQYTLTLPPAKRGCHLITRQVVEKCNPGLGCLRVGLAHVFIQHTSASLTINENACPDVRRDLATWYKLAIPEGGSKTIR